MKDSILKITGSLYINIQHLLNTKMSDFNLGPAINKVKELAKEYNEQIINGDLPVISSTYCGKCDNVFSPHLTQDDADDYYFSLVCSNPKCQHEILVWRSYKDKK